jgi:MerR family transcriptional regulator, heat shock protein HspR
VTDDLVLGGAGAPGAGGWERRLDDATAPLYTMGVVAELLGVDAQVIRRFDRDDIVSTTRSSGNQRRYSRDDIAVLSYALTLSEEGIPLAGIARILELERRVKELADHPDGG